jgi:hypothetical protein
MHAGVCQRPQVRKLNEEQRQRELEAEAARIAAEEAERQRKAEEADRIERLRRAELERLRQEEERRLADELRLRLAEEERQRRLAEEQRREAERLAEAQRQRERAEEEQRRAALREERLRLLCIEDASVREELQSRPETARFKNRLRMLTLESRGFESDLVGWEGSTGGSKRDLILYSASGLLEREAVPAKPSSTDSLLRLTTGFDWRAVVASRRQWESDTRQATRSHRPLSAFQNKPHRGGLVGRAERASAGEEEGEELSEATISLAVGGQPLSKVTTLDLGQVSA